MVYGEDKTPTIELCKCDQLIFDKEQRQSNEERIVFPINGARTIGHPKANKQKP